MVNYGLIERLAVDRDSHYLESFLVAGRAAETVADTMESSADGVGLYLAGTLIELLGLVEILLYAAIHQLGHLLAGSVLFLRA